MKHFFNQ